MGAEPNASTSLGRIRAASADADAVSPSSPNSPRFDLIEEFPFAGQGCAAWGVIIAVDSYKASWTAAAVVTALRPVATIRVLG